MANKSLGWDDPHIKDGFVTEILSYIEWNKRNEINILKSKRKRKGNKEQLIDSELIIRYQNIQKMWYEKLKVYSFRLHDLVVVERQSDMQYVNVEGVVAVITEIEGEYATITELNQQTGIAEGGTGAVELACLTKIKNPTGQLKKAYESYKKYGIFE